MLRFNKKLMVTGVLIVLIVLLAFPACRGTPAPTQPIKVGGTFSLNVATGRAQLAAVEIAFEEANAAGGVKGRPIQLTYYNDENNTEKAASNMERSVTTDKVVALVGPWSSALGIVGSKVGEKYSVPVYGPSFATEELDNHPWVFRSVGHTTEIVCTPLAQIQKMGFKKVAFLWGNSAYCINARDLMLQNAAKYGVTIVGHEAVDIGATDVTVQLTKLKALNPDCIINVLYEKEMVVMLTGLKTIGWNTPVFENIFQLMGLLDVLDPRLIEGIYCCDHCDIRKPLCQHLWDAYEKKEGKRWEFGQMATGYDAGRVIAEALKLASNPDDGTSIRDAIRKVRIEAACGKAGTMIDFSNKNWGPTAAQTQMYVIKNGKPVAID